MSLEQIVDYTSTDQNTVHSYSTLYEQLLNSKQEPAKNVLEIGTTL
jgi:phage terminase small subunit